MADVSRLNNFAANLATALRSATPEVQRRVAEYVADWVIARSGLDHPAIAAGSADEVASLAFELDDRYFAVSAKRDAAQASTNDVLAAFGKARVASAVAYSRRGELGEAIYEAAMAVEDWSELRAAVLSLLRPAGPAESDAAPDRGRM
jgi:hypothetical protein